MIQRQFVALMAFVFTLVSAAASQAAVRPIFTPGDASVIIWIQGISAGQPADLDPRALYEAMAVPETDAPGGKGKGIKTSDGAFTLSCVARPALPEDVMCSIVIKRASWTEISSRTQSARALMGGGEARDLYEKFAGPGATALWTWMNSDKRIEISSGPTGFLFSFNQKP